ncbi:hypothetical protein DUNSADRAFT_16434 [Dunaliella salina]|uniref:CASTOR/POLLUX/SYM8 ion channel conserved domain-containing protein n=1 Tax=Dunaliella salina TaxID=3046 RepID=A0ABQ7G3R2_DUNSA|nr:hypothetical protein DUNSADRAFT_16434 [Dunaliella salina]|eukprot:KAF5829189.1 hypothetical protein DUNSADRAFT_16434 [Dunaliella salina]
MEGRYLQKRGHAYTMEHAAMQLRWNRICKLEGLMSQEKDIISKNEGLPAMNCMLICGCARKRFAKGRASLICQWDNVPAMRCMLPYSRAQQGFANRRINHTVILGWSERQSIIMLREMVEAQRMREQSGLCKPIVVLSDSAKKATIDEQLLNEFGDMFNQVIMTRQGSPAAPQDLARVGAGRAGTVIWMVPEKQKREAGVNPGASLSATLTCLHSMRAPDSPPQRLVICEEGGGKGSKAKSLIGTSAGRVAMERLKACNTTTTRLTDVSELGIMAQVALQPQLSTVFEELCQQRPGQVKFYTISCPELACKTFKQARKAFPNSTLVGMVDATTGAPRLTPSDSQLVGEHDRLVLLAPDASKLTCMPWKASQQAAIDAVQDAKVASASDGLPSEKRRASNHELPQPQQKVEPHVHSPKAVVVLGHGGHMGGIAASLQMFCGPGSKVTLAVPEYVSEKALNALKAQYNGRKLDGVHFQVAQGNLSSNAFLRKLGVAQADAVVLGTPGQAGWQPLDADAQVAASVLQLQSLMEDEAAASGHSDSSSASARQPLSVVSCISNEKMKPVLQRLVHSARPSSAASAVQPSGSIAKEPRRLLLNLIMAEELLGGMLTQVAADPLLGGVFEELLNDCEGAEVCVCFTPKSLPRLHLVAFSSEGGNHCCSLSQNFLGLLGPILTPNFSQ